MNLNKANIKSNFVRLGCAAMCLFYLLGLFNGLVLETLHEVSHILVAKTHHHNFTSDHEIIDYSSLEAMAGHSHEGLEALKELLEANQPDEQESNDDTRLKLDKHFPEKISLQHEIHWLPVGNNNWTFQGRTPLWCQSVTTPPPQHS